ncbi:MAG TPA: type I-B CRISPR-associated protein Cas7/Cst2/DevR [Clostridiaceae bacterium]|nr:type I-B CRISPR-associated protein Cas7/Cst2/DevR [Clostridiaceae bacterium]
MNKKSGLTITMVFNAESLNYGEGIGNISELKKLSRGNGKVYTFASRQALRYDIARLGNKMFGWNLEVVDKSKGTVQFKDECTIKDSEEMDLFGYMKTSKKSDDKAGGSSIRSAAVRLSNAISLEDYKSDMDFLNNKGLADRINEFPNLANVEQHLSYYTYTVTIDLEKIGKDGEIELDNEVKMKRVIELLEILKVLNREIRGREENLSPLFVIGGVYNLNSPYFLGRIELKNVKQKFAINTNILEDTMKLKIGENEISQDTNIGIVKDIFENEKEIEEKFANKVSNIQDFFEKLEDSVKQYYK